MLQRVYDAGYVFLDLAGTAPAASGTIYFYENNTTTLVTVYSDTVGTESANPLTLGADGRLPNDVYVNGAIRVRVREYHITPSSGTIVFTKDNQPSVGGQQPFYVSDYGALGPDSTAAENTAGIIAACSAIQANGGGTLLFDPITYAIYPTGSFPGTVVVMNVFTGCDGICLDGRGATLLIQDSFEVTENLSHFSFVTCSNTIVKNFRFEQTPQALNGSSGQAPINIRHGCVNFVAYNIVVIGGLLGFRCDRVAESELRATYLCKNITLYNWYMEDVEYGMSFQNNGDIVKVWNFYTVRCGRTYFPYGVRNHDIDIQIDDQLTSPSCLMNNGVTADSCFLEDITLRIQALGSVAASNGNLIGLYAAINSADAHPATIRNIKIYIDHNYNQSSADYGVLWLAKTNTVTGTVDTVDRGHLIQNVEISGTIRNATNQGPLIQLMHSANCGTWGTGDFVKNLSVKNLVIEGSATTYISVNMSPIVNGMVFENVILPSLPAVEGTTATALFYRNCLFAGNYYDVVNSAQTLTGSGAIDVIHLYTYLDTTGGGTYSLADGREGQRKTIIMTVDAGDGVVTPTSFLGNPSSTITFNDAGDTIELLFTNAAWHVLGGTATVA